MKKAIVFGAGVSGKGSEKTLKKMGYKVFLIDDKIGISSKEGVKILENDKIDLFIKSPGVPYTDLVKKALELQIEVIDDIELGYRYKKNNEISGKIIAITGTNGKTTTTYLIEQILGESKVARIGTVEYKIGDEIIEAPNTTPESLDIIKMCKKSVDKGLQYLVMEVSSHGLTSGRVDMLEFDVAVFTNLTPEHLDYHKDMEDYFNAKKILFEKLKDSKNGVINIDDEYGRRIYKEFGGMTYSLKEKADLDFELIKEINPSLLGKFNMYNLLAAIGVGKILNINLDTIKERAREIKGAPGRFEPVLAGQEFKVVVDYAHTGDALENILQGVTDLKTNGKIITVFGCGGDRDRIKRPVMAEVSERYSDLVIITSDNPRTEDPNKIIDDIVKGFKNKNYIVEIDRKEAIKKAVLKAEKDDIILIAGKGHETYQILGTTKIHFDDREIAIEAIKELEEVK